MPCASAHAASSGFIANAGQLRDQHGNPNPRVQYLLSTAGNNIALRDGGFAYDTYSVSESVRLGGERYEHLPEAQATAMLKQLAFHFHRVDVTFVGANADAWLEPLDATGDILHYYTSATPITDVRTFQRIRYHNVWPNIDVEFSAGGSFEYDFILHPGADINNIALHYNGMDAAQLKDGAIELCVAQGTLAERIPMSYFRSSLRAIDIRYRVVTDIPGALTVGFTGHTGPITETIVIDPTPNRDWSTYYGGDSYEDAYGITADGAGNSITTGLTGSATAIATAGAHQSTYASSWDAFAVKLDPSGVRLWASYLGGAGDEYGHAVKCDAAGNIYLTGYCGPSAFIASAGAHQTTHGGSSSDAYLVKLNSAGVRQWGTYYGGNCWDYGHDIDIEPGTNNVYMYGQTCTLSGTAITTPGAHQTTSNGSWTGLLAKFTPTGVRIWATFFGGVGVENGNSVAVDNAGSVIIAGSTDSPAQIATAGAYQAIYAGGCCSGDGYLAKFNSSGVRQWSTYYGGVDQDAIWEVACDANRNIILVGGTYTTTNFFGTAGTYDPTFNGYHDSFIAKFSPTGTRTWGSYYGSTSGDFAYSVAVQPNDDIVVAGYTEGGGGIASAGAAQTAFGGFIDAYVARLNPNGTREWGTYFGGAQMDFAWDVAVFGNNVVYATGNTSSTNNIATPGAHQLTYGTNQDAFIVRYSDANIPLPIELLAFGARCENDRVVLQWTTATETDNDFFSIERSEEGQLWRIIGTLPGAGNSQQSTEYAFIDPEVFNTVRYYRLKQTDYDGAFSFSPTVAMQPCGDREIVGQWLIDAQGRVCGTWPIASGQTAPGVYIVRSEYSDESVRAAKVVVPQW